MIKEYSLKTDGDKQISVHFKAKEFACKDGSDKILIDVDYVDNVLEKARMYLNAPLKIVSAYRTEAYNQSCGGASNSYHLKGQAFDVRCDSCSLIKLASVLIHFGAMGVGIYSDQNFVHSDSRDSFILFREN